MCRQSPPSVHFFKKKFKLIYFGVCARVHTYVHTCVPVHVWICVYTNGGQRTSFRSRFSPSIMLVPGIELRLAGLAISPFLSRSPFLKMDGFFYGYECLPVCMYVRHVHSWHPQRSDLLELEFWRVVSHDVGVGNQIWVLFKSSKCLSLLGHLSSPLLCLPSLDCADLCRILPGCRGARLPVTHSPSPGPHLRYFSGISRYKRSLKTEQGEP